MQPSDHHVDHHVVGRIPELLDFEARWGAHSGAKDEAIRSELGITPARYYQLLGRAIDTIEALRHDPMLVKRLRRMRENRAAVRVRRVE